MKTQRRILLVAGLVLLTFAGLVALAVILLGAATGSLVALAAVAAAGGVYLGLVRPWHVRWGTTREEADAPMPGDGVLGRGSKSTTRAVTIGAAAPRVWPWLAASALWIALSDPGAFIMERRMLLGIKARAERATAPGTSRTSEQPG